MKEQGIHITVAIKKQKQNIEFIKIIRDKKAMSSFPMKFQNHDKFRKNYIPTVISNRNKVADYKQAIGSICTTN